MNPTYFTKLAMRADALDFTHAISEGTHSAFPTISYLKVTDAFRDQVKALLPPIGQEARVAIGVVPAGNYLPPHTDYKGECALNIYFQPGGANETWFFEERPGATKHWTEEGTANWYDDSDVREVGFFVAQPMDAYLLNVSRIHSIEVGDERRFVSVVWAQRKFSEVLKELR
jgi:hypothetical protein